MNGGHELRGGTLWELVKLMFFLQKIVEKNRSFAESCF